MTPQVQAERILLEELKTGSNKRWSSDARGSAMPNSQKVETAQVPVSRRVGAQTVVHPNVVYHRCIKKQAVLTQAVVLEKLEDAVLSGRCRLRKPAN